MKKILPLALAIAAPALFSQSAFAEFDYFKTDGSFKRFSVSAGWLHAAPQGDPSPMKNTTAIKDGTVTNNGSVKVETVKDIIDPNQSQEILDSVNEVLDILPAGTDLSNVEGLGDVSGTSEIYGFESFSSASGTGLKSDTTDTVGMLFNYHIDDKWSVELKAGLPPKVDILGKGKVYAPLSGKVKAGGAAAEILPEFAVKDNILITDLEQGNGVASSARAWLPAAEVHYQFGTSGVDKFRPYVGAGLMYAYFNDIDLNSGIRSDLEKAGHQIQNLKDGKAGAALEDVKSSSNMKVDVEADSAFAPIITVGATYDFNDKWFGVGSLSYAKLGSTTTITVKNDKGEELIRSSNDLDIDPFISYVGIGYRF
ncbi:MAG: OmpW family outer membrane protein [Psychrobacter sp.]|nr:OmpW family outer membrane protein [Psychrobacter sp.]